MTMLKLLPNIICISILLTAIKCQDRGTDATVEVPNNPISLFTTYMKLNGKVYTSVEEYIYRYEIFQKNLKAMLGTKTANISDNITIEPRSAGAIIKIKQTNNACDFEMSLNQFFDLTDEEFRSNYLLPPNFFNEKIHKPVSKVVTTENNMPVIAELAEGDDPLDEALPIKQDNRTQFNMIDFFKKIKEVNFKNKRQKVFEELRATLNEIRNRLDPTRFKKPEDEGLTKSCRQVIKIRGSIKNGVPNMDVSYSQSSKNLDFSQLFAERKLQSALIYPSKYMEQKFNKFVNIAGTRVPTFLNWNQISPLTPVKDQKKCNSCYVFSATASLEAHDNILNNNYRTLSEQEILDCSKENDGCIGGQPYLVFDYVIKNGLAFDSDYPYNVNPATCRVRNLSNRQRFNQLKGYVFPKQGVLNLIKALQYGPVAVVMYASDHLKYYYDGIFEGQGCVGNEIPNHSALLYGYNLESSKPYFLLKNGWGKNWGDDGHYKVSIGPLNSMNMGHCLIAQTRYNVIPVLNR